MVDHGGEDPDGLVLDDAFVAAAPVREESAEARLARMRRIEEGHRRVVAEREAERRRLRRARRWPWTVATSIVATVLVGVALVDLTGHGPGVPTLVVGSGGWDDIPDVAAGADRPTPQLTADERVRPAVEVPEHDDHAFLGLQPDGRDPVAYDPCRPLAIVVNERLAPPGARGILDEAVAVVEAATGLDLVVEGPTDEVPWFRRDPVQRDRYGDRWAPVLVAWTDAVEVPELDDYAGLGGSAATTAADGDRVYVTGTVALNSPVLTAQLGQPDGRALVRHTVVHELGHVLGLAHVDARDEVMHPGGIPDPALDLGPGDRAGLARLGAGDCHPDL